jgi:glycosyltransferase involved in cell wall biosynthesis
MFKNKKIVVVMPAYNAAKTLQKTYDEVMEQGIVDLVILVDDASRDETSTIASGLPHTKVFVHERNKGYGGNQKTCYRMALEAVADIMIIQLNYCECFQLLSKRQIRSREITP